VIIMSRRMSGRICFFCVYAVYDVCVSWFAVIACICGGFLGVIENFLVVVFVAGCGGCVFIIFG